jgi:dTDP-4-dehydrorhamnose reductase
MATKKILVTGANGQLGSELRQLSARYSSFDFVFLSREQLPVGEDDLAANAFAMHRPDFCINCAAYTAVDKAESDKELAFRVNALGPGVLAKLCEEHNCRFIHVSTDYVFDGSSKRPYKEDDEVNPQGVYGASKLEGERAVLRQNPASVIIRTSWVYSEFGKNFVKTMLRLMGEKEQLNVVDDQIGSPTYAADLAEAIMEIIVKIMVDPGYRGIYHFSNDGVISWYQFALAIKEIAGSKCRVTPIPTSGYPTPAKRPAYSVLDKTKIQDVFGIRLKDWRTSLEVCMKKLEKSNSN